MLSALTMSGMSSRPPAGSRPGWSEGACAAALAGRFAVNDVIVGDGKWNALLLDDLFDTGASMEAVCNALRSYRKIDKVYAAAITQGRSS